MRILAIDPGYEKSACLIYSPGRILGDPVIEPNERVMQHILCWRHACSHLAIEMVASYGMPVGREVFETCVWIGQFIERWKGPYTKVYRKDVKMHLCHSMKAKDSNIHAALLDRFGPGKENAVGTKKAPGPLYGIKKDLWAALAVAVVWTDLNPNINQPV